MFSRSLGKKRPQKVGKWANFKMKNCSFVFFQDKCVAGQRWNCHCFCQLPHFFFLDRSLGIFLSYVAWAQSARRSSFYKNAGEKKNSDFKGVLKKSAKCFFPICTSYSKSSHHLKKNQKKTFHRKKKKIK